MNLLKKSLTTFLLLLVLVGTCIGQETETKFKNRVGIGFTVLGPGAVLSVDLSYLITKKLSAEIGYGFIAGYMGVKYHFMSESNSGVYVGVQPTYNYLTRFFKIDDHSPGFGLYVPVGYTFRPNQNFSASFEVALNSVFSIKHTRMWGGMKFHFYL